MNQLFFHFSKKIPNPEKQQAIIRLVLFNIAMAIFSVGYYYGYTTMERTIWIAYISSVAAYTIVAFLHAWFIEVSPLRKYVVTYIDVTIMSVGIIYSGGAISPFVVYYFWSFIGSALRYGVNLMHQSQAFAVASYITIVYFTDGFSKHPYAAGVILFALIILPLNISMLRALLDKARKEVDRANSVKSQFLANMSHEIRTPLNAVLGYSEMLKEDAEAMKLDGFVKDLDRIHNAGSHLLVLINDVLDLSKIESGRIEINYEDVDIKHLVDEIVETTEPLVNKNNNRLHVSIDDRVKLVRTDPTRLKQILFNLLSNAAKFTKEGDIRLKVSIQITEGEEYLVFVVADTGIGMTDEQISKIFEPFTQADSSTTKQYGGTGLGLTITKRFCEILKGRITIESQPGHGTTFSVALPCKGDMAGHSSCP